MRYLFLLIALLPSVLASGQQIMKPEEIRRIESHLPLLEDGIVKDALANPTGVWYDRATMKIAYQAGAGSAWHLEFASTGRLGIADGAYEGNANNMSVKAFPWNPVPGLTHRCPNVDSVKRFVLPLGDDGKVLPVIVYSAELEGFVAPRPTVTGLDWLWPVGSTIIEPITVNDVMNKQHYVCIIRARTKTKLGWTVESFAPFRQPEELKEAIYKARPQWYKDRSLVEFLVNLDRKPRGLSEDEGAIALRDRTPGNPRFGTVAHGALNLNAGIDKLGPLDRELVAELLDTTVFRASAGYDWKHGCSAPTTDEEFHIVPQNYDGGFVSIDGNGCVNCHSGAQASARRHDPNNGLRGWVRGNKEGILSWHPFEPSSVTPRPNPNPKLRQVWVDAGYVAFYDPSKHPSGMYLIEREDQQ